MVDLSIIIVSFNTKEILLKCLEALLAVRKVNKSDFEIILVDNASIDGSVEVLRKLKKEYSCITLVENSENLGFSKANNIGLKHAKGKFVLFLNSDAVLVEQKEKNPLEYLISFMKEHTEVGALTCRVNLTNGKIDDACHRGYPTPWNAFCHFSGLGSLFSGSTFFNGYHLGYKDLDKAHEIDALAGAFMLVRREAGEQVGWWDEDYFFYGEDLDFCYELKQKGWSIYFVPQVQVIHYKGVSSGIKEVSRHISKADSEGKKRIQTARFAAMKIFYRKHYMDKYPKLVTWLVMKGIDVKMEQTLQGA